VFGQGTKLAPAVRSPRAAVKREQERPAREKLVERVHDPARIGQREERRRLKVTRFHRLTLRVISYQ
jgi:hypothetical protein